jgi:hypothetical protein
MFEKYKQSFFIIIFKLNKKIFFYSLKVHNYNFYFILYLIIIYR